jgi:hypothetical protein
MVTQCKFDAELIGKIFFIYVQCDAKNDFFLFTSHSHFALFESFTQLYIPIRILCTFCNLVFEKKGRNLSLFCWRIMWNKEKGAKKFVDAMLKKQKMEFECTVKCGCDSCMCISAANAERCKHECKYRFALPSVQQSMQDMTMAKTILNNQILVLSDNEVAYLTKRVLRLGSLNKLSCLRINDQHLRDHVHSGAVHNWRLFHDRRLCYTLHRLSWIEAINYY